MKFFFIILISFSLFPISHQVIFEGITDVLKEMAQSIANVIDAVRVPFQELAKNIEDSFCTRLTDPFEIGPDVKEDTISLALAVTIIRVREVLAQLLCSNWKNPNV